MKGQSRRFHPLPSGFIPAERQLTATNLLPLPPGFTPAERQLTATQSAEYSNLLALRPVYPGGSNVFSPAGNPRYE